MQFLLYENCFKEFMTNVMEELTDPQQLETLKKEIAKTKRMLIDKVRDHIVPHIANKTTVKDMLDVIVKLLQDPCENWKIILKEKLRKKKCRWVRA